MINLQPHRLEWKDHWKIIFKLISIRMLKTFTEHKCFVELYWLSIAHYHSNIISFVIDFDRNLQAQNTRKSNSIVKLNDGMMWNQKASPIWNPIRRRAFCHSRLRYSNFSSISRNESFRFLSASFPITTDIKIFCALLFLCYTRWENSNLQSDDGGTSKAAHKSSWKFTDVSISLSK